jgi:hypothetical protein
MLREDLLGVPKDPAGERGVASGAGIGEVSVGQGPKPKQLVQLTG